jgi:hypothetical protein
VSGERFPHQGPGDANRDKARESIERPRGKMKLRTAKVKSGKSTSDALGNGSELNGGAQTPALPAWVGKLGVSAKEIEVLSDKAAKDWHTPEAEAWVADTQKCIADGTIQPTNFTELDRILKSHS